MRCVLVFLRRYDGRFISRPVEILKWKQMTKWGEFGVVWLSYRSFSSRRDQVAVDLHFYSGGVSFVDTDCCVRSRVDSFETVIKSGSLGSRVIHRSFS